MLYRRMDRIFGNIFYIYRQFRKFHNIRKLFGNCSSYAVALLLHVYITDRCGINKFMRPIFGPIVSRKEKRLKKRKISNFKKTDNVRLKENRR